MSARVAERRWRLAVRLTVAAAVWALGLLLAAVLVPAYDGQTTSPATGTTTVTRLTLVQSKGLWAVGLVLVPLLAAGLVAAALAARRRNDAGWSRPVAWGVVGVLAVVCLLGITSVGAFMAPVAVALALGVRLAPGRGDVRAHTVRSGT